MVRLLDAAALGKKAEIAKAASKLVGCFVVRRRCANPTDDRDQQRFWMKGIVTSVQTVPAVPHHRTANQRADGSRVNPTDSKATNATVENGNPEVNNNPDLIYTITWLKLAKHVKARNTRFY